MGRSIHIDGIAFNEKELDELMREVLIKLGIKLENTSNIIVIVKSIELEDIGVLSSLKSTESRRNVRGQKSEAKEAGDLLDMPDLLEMRIKIRSKINIKIRFADPAALRTAQLAEDRGSV
jgi:hypothetical protein